MKKDLYGNINTILDEAEKFVNTKKVELSKRISLIQACIDKARAEREAAEAEAKEAVDSMKLTEYHAAQKKVIAADEEIRLCNEQLEKVSKEPLMTVEEYKRYIGLIDAELDKINQSVGAELSEIIRTSFIPAQDNINGAIKRANVLYEDMVHNLMHVGYMGEDVREDVRYISMRHCYDDNMVDALVSAVTGSYVYQRLRSIVDEAETE